MQPLTLDNLAPLIAASDVWADTPDAQLWLAHDNGKPRLAREEPPEGQRFSDLRRVQDLDVPITPPERPVVLVEWPGGRHRLVLPDAWSDCAPYEGRPYKLGVFDCYTLVRDWMKRERNIEMEYLTERREAILQEFATANAFLSNTEMDKWERVVRPAPGDGILFALSQNGEFASGTPNHCGVYLGEGRFLHHFANRVSCIEEMTTAWKSRVAAYMRHYG